jgi:hypothetical protein
VVAGAGQTGGDEQGAEFVAVQSGGVGLVVESGTADVHRPGVVDRPSYSA